jgi:hypothetical protein
MRRVVTSSALRAKRPAPESEPLAEVLLEAADRADRAGDARVAAWLRGLCAGDGPRGCVANRIGESGARRPE